MEELAAGPSLAAPDIQSGLKSSSSPARTKMQQPLTLRVRLKLRYFSSNVVVPLCQFNWCLKCWNTEHPWSNLGKETCPISTNSCIPLTIYDHLSVKAKVLITDGQGFWDRTSGWSIESDGAGKLSFLSIRDLVNFWSVNNWRNMLHHLVTRRPRWKKIPTWTPCGPPMGSDVKRGANTLSKGRLLKRSRYLKGQKPYWGGDIYGAETLSLGAEMVTFYSQNNYYKKILKFVLTNILELGRESTL